MLFEMLGGMGLGLGKELFFDGPRRGRERKLRAEEIRYSPWTKMGPTTEVSDTNALNSVMQGGMAGAMFGQGVETRNQAKRMNDALIGLYNRSPGLNAPLAVPMGAPRSPWGFDFGGDNLGGYWGKSPYGA